MFLGTILVFTSAMQVCMFFFVIFFASREKGEENNLCFIIGLSGWRPFFIIKSLVKNIYSSSGVPLQRDAVEKLLSS